jgi:hypothetical protein
VSVSAELMFREIQGSGSFKSYREFEDRVLAVYNNHLKELPPLYSYRHLIQFGRSRHWVMQLENGTVLVQVDEG